MSMAFLVEHGFDFNDQFKNGIPFYPGTLSEDVQDHECNKIMRGISASESILCYIVLLFHESMFKLTCRTIYRYPKSKETSRRA